MARADEMADLVRQRVGGRRALMVHDGEGAVGFGGDLSRQPAALGIMHDEHRDIGLAFDREVSGFRPSRHRSSAASWKT